MTTAAAMTIEQAIAYARDDVKAARVRAALSPDTRDDVELYEQTQDALLDAWPTFAANQQEHTP